MTSRGAPFLSIIIPAFNEAGLIGDAVNSIATCMAAVGFAYEIIIVDDGSDDETRQEAEAVAARFDPDGCCGDIAAWSEVRILAVDRTRGRGSALRRGAGESRGRFLALMDADLSVCPSYLADFLVEAAAGADLVLSSRCLPRSFNHGTGRWADRTSAMLLGRLAGKLLGFGNEGSDIACGLVMMRGDFGRALLSRALCDGWGLEAELIFLAGRAELCISALPVTRKEREGYRRNKPVKAMGLIKELLTVRARAAGGGYGPRQLPTLAPAVTEDSAASDSPGYSGLFPEQGTEAGSSVGESALRDLLRRS